MKRPNEGLFLPLMGALVGLAASCFSAETDDSGTGASTDSGGTDSGSTGTTATTASTTGPGDNCGNGAVEEGEECDLALANSDNGLCTSQCKIATCGDGLLHLGEEDCDEGGESDTCDADCTAVNCGDGTVNATAGEACDDGDNGPGLACRENCQPNVCGDNDVGPDEECDNGEENGDGALCTAACTVNVCGDGNLGPDEGCDDGNTDPGDGCSPTCELTSCGNGTVDAGEECDDGKNGEPDDGCTDLCKGPACGDGFFQPMAGEECDDGAGNGSSQACTSTCKAAACGDGFVWSGQEECDDGNNMPADSCTNECTLPVCGDGIHQPQMGEECDQGAENANNASCKADCTTQKCGDGFVGPGEACDDGNTTPDDGCTNECTLPGCGDGIVQAGEDCDDAGQSPTCDSDCTDAECGDGVLNTMAGEQCDDGNKNVGDGCHSNCTVYKGVFATSELFTGDLAGLAGADQKCQSLASSAGLPGVYKAWLSTKATPAMDRLTHAMIPYRRIDGTGIAMNWADLTDGTLLAPIIIDENGDQLPGIGLGDDCGTVWTHTLPNGEVAGEGGGGGEFKSGCANWTSDLLLDTARTGNHTATGQTWSMMSCDQECSTPLRLYCFEQ